MGVKRRLFKCKWKNNIQVLNNIICDIWKKYSMEALISSFLYPLPHTRGSSHSTSVWEWPTCRGTQERKRRLALCPLRAASAAKCSTFQLFTSLNLDLTANGEAIGSCLTVVWGALERRVEQRWCEIQNKETCLPLKDFSTACSPAPLLRPKP